MNVERLLPRKETSYPGLEQEAGFEDETLTLEKNHESADSKHSGEA